MSNSFNPLVSIIIPVYNGENFLNEAIESALNQSYTKIEVIVVNDGSTDNTKSIAEQYGSKIVYIEKKNGGVATALNLGIEKMNGQYFSWLSHDDLYDPDKVLKQIEMLKKLENKNVIVGCNVNIVNGEKELIKKNKIPKNGKNSIPAYLAFDQKVGLNGCSLLIPKTVFDKYGVFDENLKVTQDYDLWYRFAKKVEFVFVNDNLVFSRQHEEQGSKKMFKEVDYEVDRLHSRFIKNLTEQELIDYCENNIDIYYNYFIQYKNMHCIRSAYETALQYTNMLLKNNRIDKALSFVNETVFNNSAEIDINNNLLNIKNKKQKRILFYNNIWIKGGIERVLTKVFQFLKKDYEIYFVSFNFSENKGYELPNEIHKIQISDQLSYMLPSVLIFICKLLDIDLFIGNQNLNLDFLPTYKYMEEENIKTIACNHYNYFLPFEVDWLRSIAYYRNEYYNHAKIVTWATNFCTEVYNGINQNGYYLPNPNTYDTLKKIPVKKKNHIVSVARFDDTFKRIDLLLSVFSKVVSKIPDATLTVVGNVNYDIILPGTDDLPLSEFIKKLSLPKDSIQFVGEQADLKDYYKEAELFLFTSETEGFGMVINEAASFATPSIAFEISGLEDLIVENSNGFLIEKYDIDKMAEKVIQYLTNDNIKNKMIKESINYVERFNLVNTEKRWNDMLSKAFSDKDYNINNNNVQSKIIKEYENTILSFPYYSTTIPQQIVVKTSIFSKVKYYLKTYGWKATIKKVFKKIIK